MQNNKSYAIITYNILYMNCGDKMARVNLRTVLENKTENQIFSNEVNAILEKDKLKYFDNDVMVIIEKKDNGIIIYRKCDEYDIILPLELNKKTKGKYDIKSLGILDLEVEATLIEINDNNLKVDYKMIVDRESISEFSFIIDYMKVGDNCDSRSVGK